MAANTAKLLNYKLLQDLFINKAIDFETYLKNIPDQLFPNKEKILSETQESLSPVGTTSHGEPTNATSDAEDVGAHE